MRKIIACVLSLLCVCLITNSVSFAATSYSKRQTRDVTVYTATYNVGETATFYSSGDDRWSYSNLTKTYIKGDSCKGVTVTSQTSGDSSTPTTQTTKRKVKLQLTDYSYINHTTTTTFTWTFNENTNSFQ